MKCLDFEWIFRQTRQIFAGIIALWQENLTQYGEKSAKRQALWSVVYTLWEKEEDEMDFLWIIVQIIASSFGIVCYLALSRWRFRKYIVFITAASYIIIFSVINFIAVRDLSYLLENYPCMDIIYRVSNTSLAVALVFILTKQPLHQKVYTALSMIVGVLIVDTIAITLRMLIGNTIELLLELLLYSSMTYIMIVLRNPFLQIVEYLDKRLKLLSAVPAILTASFFLQISFPTPLERNPGNVPVALMLCLVSAAVYGVKLFLFKTLRARMVLEWNVTMMKLNTSALEHQNELIAQNAKKAALFRHDLRHIAKMMSACAENGDMEGIRELISSLDKNVGEGSIGLGFIGITGHKQIDAMVCYYIEHMRECEIDFVVHMNPIESTRIDMTELAVVLANALENAVRACEEMRSNRVRAVRLDGQKRGKQYFLEIANTIDSAAVFNPTTGLPVRKGREGGLGSQSIAYFTKKHSIALEYKQTNGWFHLRMLI